jgi:hypothetical protein
MGNFISVFQIFAMSSMAVVAIVTAGVLLWVSLI